MRHCKYTENVIDTARIVHKNVRSFIKRSSVRPSVRLSRRSTAAAACGGFAAECPACKRCRSIAGAGARQQMRQCHVDGRGTRLIADLLT